MMRIKRPMVQGGVTHRVATAGGDELSRKLQLLLAGERVDVAMFALINAVGILAILASEDEASAIALIHVLADDVKNHVSLNDAEVRQQLASAAPVVARVQ